MNSKIFHITGSNPDISCKIFPVLQVSSNAVISLTHFSVFNSIPNIDETNNIFTYQETTNSDIKNVVIPIGTYELTDLEAYLKNHLGNDKISIKANINTLKCEFSCKYNVDFTKSTVGKLFGMSDDLKYNAGEIVESTDPIQISKINTIQINLNIVSGSYINGESSNCLYKCFISTPPGFRIVESPNNPIYLPVNTSEIDTLHVTLTDEAGSLINLRGEEFSLELHLKL